MKGYFCMEGAGYAAQGGIDAAGASRYEEVPGIDISTGSLGQGLACGVGMAIDGKRRGRDYRVYVAVGDGECQEGEIWEACQTANKYRLDNLIVFVDDNGLQLDGTTDEVMPNINLGHKFQAFGFDVYEIDGNDMEQVVGGHRACQNREERPSQMSFRHTVKGKGVSFMENECGWHGTAPNKEQYEQAMKELDSQYNSVLGGRIMEEKKIATRDGFGEAIVELGKENPDIYVVDIDIGKSCKTGQSEKNCRSST